MLSLTLTISNEIWAMEIIEGTLLFARLSEEHKCRTNCSKKKTSEHETFLTIHESHIWRGTC